MKSDATLFVIFLLVTVAVLAVVVVTGLRARRRVHLCAVVCLVASLGTAIFFAERLGEHYDLESAGVITPVHLTLAKITTLGYLLPIATGLRTLRKPATRKLHGRVAFTIVALTLVTTVTGVAMIALAEPL